MDKYYVDYRTRLWLANEMQVSSRFVFFIHSPNIN